MKVKKILIGVIVFAAVFGGGFGVRKFVLQNQNQIGSLRVESIPRTKVFLNDKEVGQTPYLGENLKAGEYKLKLQDWETTIKITPELLTYVTREFGEETGSQILFLEKLPAGASELAVVSDPDGATVSVDSLPKGQAPLLLKDLSLGDKIITVSKDGFADQIVKAKIVAGFRLNAIVKLKKIAEGPTRSTADLIASGSGQVAAAEVTKPYVTVKSNSLGFLNVRSGPDAGGSLVGKIYPGDKYSLVAQTDNWVKIKWPTGTGWVWQDYVVVTEY